MTENHGTSGTTALQPIPVFWTGGWDSTFRVLELLFRYECRVQPIYVIDVSRRSFQIEIDTMNRIRDEIASDHPALSSLLAETIFLKRQDLENETLTSQPYFPYYAYLNEHYRSSTQYPYLSMAGKQTGYDKIEASIQGGDESVTFDFLRDRLVEVSYDCGAKSFVLEDWSPTSDFERGMKVFENFSFPILTRHPSEMEAVAETYGFIDLVNAAWTCQFPIFGRACGMCYTCRSAIKAGKTRYYSGGALFRNKYAKVLNPIHIALRNPKGVWRTVQKRLRSR